MGKIAPKVLEVLVWVVLYLIAGLIDAWWELRKLGKGGKSRLQGVTGSREVIK